jgi:serine-type D-Ala-D-Ala endopeptidase (penicillin-binding protein 7)
MVSKYLAAFLVIALCVGMPSVPATARSSKSPAKNIASHRGSSIAHVGQDRRKLVLRSAAALVEDQRTGELLVQKQTSAILPIASITKLMTAMVVLDARLELQESLTIERGDVDVLRHSRSRLPVGTHLTRRDTLLLALMASDNRSAHALGRSYLGGFEACVTAMNAKAQSLGLTETHFEDTSGLSCSNVSSARDLVRLIDAAYRYPLIRELTTCKRATIHSGRRTLAFHNTNLLIRSPRWQIGLSKTGFTDEAGRCLVMQANVAERPVLIVLLDSQGRLSRVGDANRIKQWLEGPSQAQRTRHG